MSSPQAKNVPRHKVLIVDDDEHILDLFKRVLEAGGFSVMAASGGGAAAKYHSELGSVNLLITDIDMPGKNGIELAEELCIKQPDLPVLFITGGLCFVETREEHPQRTILQKPFSAHKLIESVTKILSVN
jgi:DNA-binding NtrC family response regulator